MNYLCIPIVLYLEFVKRSSFYSLFFLLFLSFHLVSLPKGREPMKRVLILSIPRVYISSVDLCTFNVPVINFTPMFGMTHYGALFDLRDKRNAQIAFITVHHTLLKLLLFLFYLEFEEFLFFFLIPFFHVLKF